MLKIIYLVGPTETHKQKRNDFFARDKLSIRIEINCVMSLHGYFGTLDKQFENE